MFVLEVGNAVAQSAGGIISFVEGNFGMLALGIVLIIAAIVVIFFLKNIIINSVIGIVIWAIAVYIFQVNLNFWLSLIISIIFGPAGIGVLLFLKFFGISI